MLAAPVHTTRPRLPQALLLRSGVLAWVVPLLLAYDTTHSEPGSPVGGGAAGSAAGEKGPAAAEAGEGAGTGTGGGRGLPPALDVGAGGRSVPDFLGLGVDRPNMQVGGGRAGRAATAAAVDRKSGRGARALGAADRLLLHQRSAHGPGADRPPPSTPP